MSPSPLPLVTLSQNSILVLELLGIAAFAISGVLAALRKRLDIVGICVCGFLTAFGGGTLRDVLIDRRPFFWVEHQYVLLGTLVLSIVCATMFRRGQLERSQRWLQAPDAIGLGLFCSTGVHLSWMAEQPALVAILMGVITGTFGGVLRDLVCNEIPDLFRDHRPYALCAAAGGAVYVMSTQFGLAPWLSITACALVTATLRLLAIRYGWTLPAIGSGNQQG